MNQNILFSQKHPEFLRSPTGKLVSVDWILIPTYKDIVRVKLQIRWCEDIAVFFEGKDEGVVKHYRNFADLLRSRIQRIAK